MKTGRSLKTVVIILGLTSIALLGGYYFLYSNIEAKSIHISNMQADLSLENDKQDYLVSMQRLIQSKTIDINKVDSSIIAKDGHVAFIETLESLAKSRGLSIAIDSLTVVDDSKVKAANLSVLNIKLKTSGSWAGVYNFLSELESLPFKIKIINFAFLNTTPQTGTVGKATSNWDSSIELSVLEYK